MANHPLNDVVQRLRRAVQPVRDDMTDAELLGAFVQERDEAALATLVRRHGPLVWGVCHRVLRDHQEAEDAFQATFLLLVRRAATIREKAKVAHWLYRVAHQTALGARAIAARRAVRERQVTEMPEPAQTEHDLWSELQPLLDQELNRLPDHYGVVIVLCDLEGKTRREVARQLGWPEGTVAGRLARARAMLAKRLARHGLVASGGTLVTLLSQNAASACVPTSVVSSTVKAVTLVAAGQSVVPGVISVNVATLTEGVLRGMLLMKLKMAIALLLMVALGLGLLMHSALAQRQPGVEGGKEEKANQASAAEDADQGLTQEPKRRHTLQGHTQAVLSVVFSPDGKTLASGSMDNTVKLWDLATGKERATLQGHSCGVRSLAFSPDGKYLASGIMGSPGATDRVKLWTVATGTELTTLKGLGGCEGLGTVAFSPDGKTLASTEYNPIKLWDVTTNKERTTLQGHTEVVSSVVFSPDGKTLASGSRDKTVRLWDVATGKERATLQGHSGVRSLAFSPDGKTLASADGNSVKLWELATGKERFTFQGHTTEVLSVAFSPDGKTVASTGKDGIVKLWDRATGKEQTILNGHAKEVRSVAFSPNGKTLASATEDGTVQIWDVPAPKKTDSSKPLASEDLARLWATLAGEDVVKAYRSEGMLVGAPDQAVRLLKQRLRPALEPNTQQITSYLTDLESDRFAVRQKATVELETLGEQAEATLRQKLADKPTAEVRQRIEQLLSKIEQEQLPPESMRAARAVEVLEYIGSPEAKAVLETLAGGTAGARLTKDAKASLARLYRQVVAGNP